MKWLSDNYKWLFDGAGIILLLAVVQYLVKRYEQAKAKRNGPASQIIQGVAGSAIASGSNISQRINSPTTTLNLSLPAPRSGTPARERYDEWRETIDELDQMANAFLPIVERRVGDDSWDFRAGIRRGNRVLHDRILIAAPLDRLGLVDDWNDLVRHVQDGHDNPDRWDKRSPTMGGFYQKETEFKEKLIRVAREDMQAPGEASETRAIQSDTTIKKVREESDENPLKEPWKVALASFLVVVVLAIGFVWKYHEASAKPPQMIENHGTSDSVTAVVKRDWHNKNNWRQYLRRGMTKDEVRQLFGEPEKVKVYSELETWAYGSGDVQFYKESLDAWTEPNP
jgi:hypothetical protein